MISVGIDIGGTNLALALVSDAGGILARGSRKTPTEGDVSLVADELSALLTDVLSSTEFSRADLSRAGVGCPGSIDRDRGEIYFAGNLRFQNAPLRDTLERTLSLPVSLENDANTAALAEALVGGAKGCRNMILLTLGTGVGGGVVLDGTILSGAFGTAGELGHTVIVEGGAPCTCGRRGCLEAYASAPALLRLTREEMTLDKNSVLWDMLKANGTLSGRAPFEAKRRGDRAGTRAVEAYIGYLACGVANFINIFGPEMVLIGGGISGEGDDLILPLREAVFPQLFPTGHPPRIERAALGNDAGLIGAALLGGERALR
ncbi:ROK family protein [Oscillospiraceae bacterium OttesenSCG-928-G22]|nr:ROK family protein [Oscillospiraceae bacterium OttesenSCG-928-G22]